MSDYLIVLIVVLAVFGLLYLANEIVHAIRRYQIWRVMRPRKIEYGKLNHVVIRNNDDLDYWLEHGGKNDWLDISGIEFDGQIDANKYGAVWFSYCYFRPIVSERGEVTVENCVAYDNDNSGEAQ